MECLSSVTVYRNGGEGRISSVASCNSTRLAEKVLFFHGKPPLLRNLRDVCSAGGKSLNGLALLESAQCVLAYLWSKPGDEVHNAATKNLNHFKQRLRAEFPVETGPVCKWP